MDRWMQKALLLMEVIQGTALQITALRNTQMREFGLDRGRWAVLLALSRSDYCLSISDLARVLKQSRQATQRMATSLSRDGWVDFLPNCYDRRLLQLELTLSGKRVIRHIQQRFSSSVILFSAHVDARTMAVSTELLRNLRTRIGAMNQTD